MDPKIDKEIQGMRELLRKLDNRLGIPEAARRFLTKWAEFTEAGAKRNMKRGPGGWLWKTHTRRSMTHHIFPATGMPDAARVGSNQDTARWGEFGTGLLSEDPKSSKRRHWPPAAPLEAWAVAHGFSGGAEVARIIGLRGGLKPRRFLRNAAEDAEKKLPIWLDAFRKDIERLAPESDH